MIKNSLEVVLEYAWDEFDEVLRREGFSEEQVVEFNRICKDKRLYHNVYNVLKIVEQENDQEIREV